MTKIIVYGRKVVNKDFKTPTHNVTAIHVDNFAHMVTFNIEKGQNVDVVNLSMERCAELGIINIEKLENYCR
jgi:hypothetical protein